MKAKLLYIIVILAFLAFLIGIGQARAERLVFKNKCGEVLLTDPVGFDCYNRSQGADNIERLSTWKALKKQAKRQGLKLPLRVVLTDPKKIGRGIWDYKTYKQGKTLYFSVMSGCFNHNIEAGLEALKR
jgi:hypothetical protein